MWSPNEKFTDEQEELIKDKNIFSSRNKALSHHHKYKFFRGKSPNFWGKYPHKWETGDHILFQHITGKLISRPIYAIFAGYGVWDQALVIHYVLKDRGWMTHCRIITNKEIGYCMEFALLDPEVDSIQLWTDDIKVLGWWKTKPVKSMLKEALTKVK